MAAGNSEFNGWQVTIVYGIRNQFKDIVALFSTDGSMSESFLKLLTVSSVGELRSAQAAGSKLINMDDKAALTIIAIKILNEHFTKDKKLW